MIRTIRIFRSDCKSCVRFACGRQRDSQLSGEVTRLLGCDVCQFTQSGAAVRAEEQEWQQVFASMLPPSWILQTHVRLARLVTDARLAAALRFRLTRDARYCRNSSGGIRSAISRP